MATLCKNCGSNLEFNPKTKRVVCRFCGSSFQAEDVETYGKELLEKIEPEAYSKVHGHSNSEYMESYVYSCTQCGGEIIINGTETSTSCIYCGSTNVVFSRIAKTKRPHEILPFQISKEEALEHIHAKFKKGWFIPNEIKNLKPEHVRGIYIPYWIVSAEHSDAAVIVGSEDDDRSKKIWFGRAGTLTLNNLPLDGSTMLPNELSEKLQPYSLSASVPFDEDYLLGFYSDASDVTFGELKDEALYRVENYFNTEMIDSLRGLPRTVKEHDPYTIFNYDKLRYTMLPVWFVTFMYEGVHHTILVNGQTGKIVGAVPWNKKKFNTCVLLTGALLSALAFLLFRHGVDAIVYSERSIWADRSLSQLLITILVPIVMLVGGFSALETVKKKIKVTQSSSIFNFVKKRQG